MINRITKELIGKRILIKDNSYSTLYTELRLVEISPSEKIAKMRNTLGGEFWADIDSYYVADVLEDIKHETKI